MELIYQSNLNQSNELIKPFLHQLMSQSAIQKPSLKPQTASNADVEAQALFLSPWSDIYTNTWPRFRRI